MPAYLENSAVATGLEKVSFHSNPKERQCPKCSNYHTIALTLHTSKVMLKILQHRVQQYLTCEFHMFKLDLEKAEELEVKLPSSIGSLKKQESFRKNIYFCFIYYAKYFDCGSKQTVENSERDENTRRPYLPPEKPICSSGRNS